MSDKPPQLHKDFQGYGRTSSFRPNPHYEKWLNYRENYRTTLSAIRGRQVFQMLAWGIVVPIGLWKLCVHTQETSDFQNSAVQVNSYGGGKKQDSDTFYRNDHAQWSSGPALFQARERAAEAMQAPAEDAE